jgi:hypothetical protein
VEFKQDFTTSAMDCKEHDLTITMTLKNVCRVTLENLMVSRYFDGDVAGDEAGDVNHQTRPSVAGIDDDVAFGDGLSLTALNFTTSHILRVESSSLWQSEINDCTVSGQSTPAGPGDLVGQVTYQLGNLAAGASKTVKVVYRHF